MIRWLRSLWRHRDEPDESIRAVIHQRAQTLLAGSEARLDAERVAQIEHLEQLHRLAEIAEKTADKTESRRHARTIAVAMFAAAAVAILLLISVRVSSLQVDLDLHTTVVAFQVDGHRPVTEALPATVLAISGIARADCPSLDVSTVTRNHSFAARLKDPAAHLSLAELSPAGETNFSLATDEVAYQLELVVHGTLAANAQATADGAVDFGGMPNTMFGGQTVTAASASSGSLSITIRLPGPRKANLVSPDLEVGNIAFGRTNLEVTSEQRVASWHSGILEGKVVREGVDDSPVTLAEAELLELDCARGELRRVELGDAALHVKFHGSVCGLHAGYDGVRRDLMPTWFEWIQARAPLKALWVSTFWLFGLIASLLAWWKGKS